MELVKLSRITNKWMKLGVPLVGCGDCSAAAHGKLWGISSIHKQSLVSFFSKYNTYGLPLSNEWCLAILVHRERPINQLSLSNCLDIKANPPFYTLEVEIDKIAIPCLKWIKSIQLKNRPYQKFNFKGGLFSDSNWSDAYLAVYGDYAIFIVKLIPHFTP